MNLFKSKFAKLEALAAAKPEDRTPEMLSAAQAEMDSAQVGVILVPKSETITSAADLQKHMDTLETNATSAKAEAETALADAKKAQEALVALKGERVLGSQNVSSDKGTGGDSEGQPNAAAEAHNTVHNPEHPWNAMADRLGYTVTQA